MDDMAVVGHPTANIFHFHFWAKVSRNSLSKATLANRAPMPPPQQALIPQNNPFDINSELIPFQEQEVEAVFKTPELDDFLLPPCFRRSNYRHKL